MTTLPGVYCLEADPSDTINPSVLEYLVCGLPAGHAHGHRWQPCGAECVVPFVEGDIAGRVVVTCSRRGHAGRARHALEWEDGS